MKEFIFNETNKSNYEGFMSTNKPLYLKNAFKISSPCTQEKSMRKKNVIASLQKYSSTEFKIYRMMQTKNNYFHGKINDPQDKY